MNCKPGCNAFYVGPATEMKGQVFQCLRVDSGISFRWGEPIWEVTPKHCYGHSFIRDSSLRPINNPGEDAQDNAWDWLPPVPTEHKETV